MKKVQTIFDQGPSGIPYPDVETQVKQPDFATTEFLLLHQNALKQDEINFSEVLTPIWRGWPESNTRRVDLCQKQMQFEKTNWILFQTPNIKDFYKLGSVIGTPGQYGTVRSAINTATGQECAVKVISKTLYDDNRIRNILFQDLRYEVYIMDVARRHPNIVEIYEVFESVDDLYIVMEQLQGEELYTYIQKNVQMTEIKICRIFSQMLNSIFYLHSLNIIHSDIKPENFVFKTKDNKQLKLIDFGMAKITTWGKHFSRMNGTPYYVAPEVLNFRYNESSDIWSLGICLYTLMYGVPPFFSTLKNRKEATAEIYKLTKKGFNSVSKPGYGPWFPSHVHTSALYKDLVSRLLRSNVADRITSGETFNHSWLKLMYLEDDGPKILNPVMTQSFVGNHSGGTLFREIIKILHQIGFLNPHQEDVVFEEYNKMDTNHDGKVDWKEFKKSILKIDPLMEESNIRAIFTIADLDQDGVLNSEEFIAARIHGKIVSKIDRLEKLFKIMDTDDDGYIDEHDVKSILETCCEANLNTEHHKLKYYRGMIDEVNTKHDGKLSFREFLKMFGVEKERPSNLTVATVFHGRQSSYSDGLDSDPKHNDSNSSIMHFRVQEPDFDATMHSLSDLCQDHQNKHLNDPAVLNNTEQMVE